MKLTESPNQMYKNQPSLLIHFLNLVFCLHASRQSEPNTVSAPKLQNSIRGTFLVNSWVDLTFQAPRKWIKPISLSSPWYNAVYFPFHSEYHFLITLWSVLCRRLCLSLLRLDLSASLILVVKKCRYILSDDYWFYESRFTSVFANFPVQRRYVMHFSWITLQYFQSLSSHG